MNTITTASTVTPFTQNLKQPQPKQQTAKEAIAANVQALIEQLEQGHSDGLTAYLTAMGRFHNYSFGNILEIARQKPDAKRSEIMRIARGVYLATVFTRFGRHSPGVHGFIQQLSIHSGEAIAPFGAACANALGLTTQVPIKIVYWTSGRTRSYKLGKLTVYLQHVPDWRLVLWDEPPGELVRALAWAGPAEASKVLRQIVEKAPKEAVTRVQQHAALFPPWLRDALQQMVIPCARSSGGKSNVPRY